MLITEALSLFEDYMESHELRSGTIKQYLYYTKKYFTFFNITDTGQIEDLHHIRFIKHMKDRGYAGSTINIAVHAIIYFYDTILDIQISKRKFPRLKYTKKDVVIFNEKEINTLFECANVRDKVFIALGIDCGLRRNEVAKLKFENLNSQTREIKIEDSKYGKGRTLKMSDFVFDTLLNYCRLKRPGVTSGYLFPSPRKEGYICEQTVSDSFKRVLKRSGLEKKGRRFHSLRHTFATVVLRATHDIFLLKKLLGHSSLSSTIRYCHLDTEFIQEAVLPSEFWRWKHK